MFNKMEERPMKIVCVCGMGLGSSLIAKMNVDTIMEQEGIEASVENCDLGSITAISADWYVTTKELADNMPSEFHEKTIILSDFISLPAIRQELLKYIK